MNVYKNRNDRQQCDFFFAFEHYDKVLLKYSGKSM